MDGNVCSTTVVVPCTHGVHMRVASRIVESAKRFQSKIELEWDGVYSDARSILSMLKLGAVQGARICVRATGEDAGEACAAIEALFDSEAKLCGVPDNKSVSAL